MGLFLLTYQKVSGYIDNIWQGLINPIITKENLKG